MKILILYFEPSILRLLQFVLKAEGYPFTATPDASEAIQTIEDSADSYLILTDNLQVNREVREALAALKDRPSLRSRLWIVSLTVFDVPTWMREGLIDEHMPMPFSADQVWNLIEAHVGPPPR